MCELKVVPLKPARYLVAASLTNRRAAERIVELSPAEVGLWRSLGARFHGMEEVVGSIPTRSTKSL